jgi:hypothetical protein
MLWDICFVVHSESTDISEEHVFSIFRVKKHIRQEMNMKQVASKYSAGLHGILSQKIELILNTAVRTSNPTELI